MTRKEPRVAESPKPGNLELNVTNFGPIAEAAIDLRPMTVFVGPSNTGKSYLAILIYALHRFFCGSAIGSGFVLSPSSHSLLGQRRYFEGPPSISSEDVNVLSDWAIESFRTLADSNWQKPLPPTLPKSIARMVRERLGDIRGFGQALDNEIARCFGISDTKTLVRNGINEHMEIVAGRLLSMNECEAESFGYQYTRTEESLHLTTSVPDTTPLRPRHNAERPSQIFDLTAFTTLGTGVGSSPTDQEKIYLADWALAELADVYCSDNLNPLTRKSYYLPADRTGIMHAHRVVVSSLIGHAPRAALGPQAPLPALSGVLADFLEVLIGLSGRAPLPLGDEKDLAKTLETDLLGGAIVNRDSIAGYPEFSYMPDGWVEDLPLMRASSMVSELAPVVLYLRHVVNQGEVLIIEEPESHLHPEMQVAFTRLLAAAAAQAGVRVLITTHSEWVLDELANLVRLSDLPESSRKAITGTDLALSPDDLGVWLFEPKNRPKGSVVKEIPFDEDFGGFRSGFRRSSHRHLQQLRGDLQPDFGGQG